MLIQLIKKVQKSLRVLIKALGSDRLTRFLLITFLTFTFVLQFMGINAWVEEVRSEGTVQINDNTTNGTYLFEYNAGGTFFAAPNARPIYVNVINATDIINISLCGWTSNGAGADRLGIEVFRTSNSPNFTTGTELSYTGVGSNVVAGSPGAFDNVNDGAIGRWQLTTSNARTATQTTATLCPNNTIPATPVGSLTTPVRFTVPAAGTYEIRLYNDNGAAGSSANNVFTFFDITVTPNAATNPNPASTNGQVWSRGWAFNGGNTFAIAGAYDANFFIRTPGGRPGTEFLWQLDLNRFAPQRHEITANGIGLNAPFSRYSVNDTVAPGASITRNFPIYLAYPAVTPDLPDLPEPTPPIISSFTFTDSDGQDNTITSGTGVTPGVSDTGDFRFTTDVDGTYELTIDANQNGVFGANDKVLFGQVSSGVPTVVNWDGTGPGFPGAKLPPGTYPVQLNIRIGEYHFVARDAETSGGVPVYTTPSATDNASGPGNGLSIWKATGPGTRVADNVFWDDSTFLDGSSNLPSGGVSGTAAGSHTWGNYDEPSSIGNNAFIDTWVYGAFTLGVIPAIIGDVDNNDFGDAPDTYGTNKNATVGGIGASQLLSTTIRLGTAVTDEELPGTDGQPNAAANGDDAANSDDEDGVASFPALAITDATYTVPIRVQNTSGADAFLGSWIDFNGNGSFQAGEGIVQTIPNGTNGIINVTWPSLPGIVAGNTYARFRINNDPLTTSDFIGGKRNGEIEDYSLTITSGATTYDWGDAPDGAVGVAVGNYNTTISDNGAAHILNASLRLGTSAPDLDTGLLQNATADADDNTNTGSVDDEDGVTLPNTLTTASAAYSATVNVTNTVGTPATLVGWIDFNRNGVFEATEGQTATVADNTTGGTVTLTWSGASAPSALIPANGSGNTYARFRIGNGILNTSTPTGIIGRGEVEDYPITINPIDLGDAPDTAAGIATGNYETLIANGGASHTIINTLRIGATTDTDSGLLQNAAADADDSTNTGSADDEDGVSLGTLTTASTTYSATVTVTNTTGSPATLVGWVDFNRNGNFENTATESQLVVVPNNALPQVINLSWTGFAAPTVGNDPYARFRLSDGALTTSTPNGAFGNGEVEDYRIVVTNPTDFGDAPDSGIGTGVNNYETLSASNGASHTILATLRLGTNATDPDSGTLQNLAADADDTNNTDDENGVTPAALTTTSTAYSATVNVLNNTGANRTLVGWVDFNKNGLFEATEGQTASVPTNVAAQNVVLNWGGLSGLTVGNTYARFRISDGALTTSTPNGLVGNGEVEDYVVPINAPSVPSLNVVKRITAINGTNITGFVDGADVLPSNDNDARWPSPNTQYLRGAIACTTGTPCNTISGGRPGDTVEYTIYFLSNGSDNLRNVSICDRIPSNSTFEPNTYAAGQGILLGWDSQVVPTALPDPTNSTTVASIRVPLTNIADVDKGQFIANPTALPTAPCGAAANTNGGVVVDVVSGATTVPIATASGVPIPSYGFVRFNVRVNQ